MSKRKPKDKPCWDVDVYESLRRTATIRVSAWTEQEAIQMACRGDHPTADWDEGDWSTTAIAPSSDGPLPIRKVSCDG